MDIELMRRLSPRVNVIPVIGKADSFTPSELKGFKKRVGTLDFLVDSSLKWFYVDYGRH
jgi:septin family protein